MAWVGRRAISADRRPRANGRAVVGVEGIVTLDAQRTKLAQAEEFVIATVRLNVVGDRRRRDATGLQAEPVQWLDM
jgi:hypothetical protein